MGCNIFGIKGGTKVRTSNFLSGGSVFVEKMHISETKMYHFQKKFACGEQLSCYFTHKMFTSYNFHLEQADN